MRLYTRLEQIQKRVGVLREGEAPAEPRLAGRLALPRQRNIFESGLGYAMLLPMPLILSGCKIAAAIGLLTMPPQIEKAEYELTEGRLAIVMDCVRPEQADPVFETALHKQIVKLFRENKIPCQIVPYENVIELKQAQPDYRAWSLQKIGRKLGADQILYLRIEQLRLRSRADVVVTPHVEMRIKLIGTQEPAVHARLWPGGDAEPDGRMITHQRSPVEVENPELMDSETTKLARETAYYVARHFHEYDTEINPPREP